MVVAFLEEKTSGATLMPPKNAHITLKKKFKLKNNLDEGSLIKLLTNDKDIKGQKLLKTGKSEEYGSKENMIITIKNPRIWTHIHQHLLNILIQYTESRDPHFEGKNYLPHITWKLRGEVNLNPVHFENKTFDINYIYLMERIHPTESIARIVAKIPL